MLFLIAEDSVELRATISVCVTGLGHQVLCAPTGKEALSQLAQRYFDVVITDVLMPDVDGFEVIQEVRNRYPSTRILVITGGSRLLDAAYCATTAKAFGAHGALLKPFSKDALINAVNAVTAAEQA